MSRIIWSVWVPVVGVALWQLAASAGLLSPIFAPAPSALLRTAAQMMWTGELTANVGATLARTVGGFVIGAAIGLVIGMLMGGLPRVLRSLDPIISALNATPKLVLLPLLLLLLGLGETARIALIALTVLIIVAMHTADAVRHIRPVWVELAVNYGARTEITDAVRAIAARVQKGEIDPASITDQTIHEHLYTAGLPDPDLLVRTAGEMRVSNYLLWQISYAELHVTDVLWPDFGVEDLHKAVRDYAKRTRRYGGLTGEQPV